MAKAAPLSAGFLYALIWAGQPRCAYAFGRALSAMKWSTPARQRLPAFATRTKGLSISM